METYVNNPAMLSETVDRLKRATFAFARDRLPLVEGLKALASNTEASDLLVNPQAIIRAIQDQDWGAEKEIFNGHSLVGSAGHLLLVGRLQNDSDWPNWSKQVAIFARARQFESLVGVNKIVASLIERSMPTQLKGSRCGHPVFGRARPVIHPHEVAPLLAVEVLGKSHQWRGCQLIQRYCWPDLIDPCGCGPTLFDAAEDRRQLEGCGPGIEMLFRREASSYILEPFRTGFGDQDCFHNAELLLAGQASGWGCEKKLAAGILRTVDLMAVERFRARGMALKIASESMDLHDFSRFIRIAWCRSFAIDSIQPGGAHLNPRVRAAMLEFYYLLKGGLGDNGTKLFIQEMSPEGLRNLVQPMIAEALTLTSREVLFAEPERVLALYSGFTLADHAVEPLFERAVRTPLLRSLQ